MGERGAVHVYQACWTRAKEDGTRELLRSTLWYWRFWYHGRAYQGGPGKESKAEARELGEARKREVTSGQEQDWRKFTMFGLYQLSSAYKVTWAKNTVVAFEGAWKRIFRHIPDSTLVQWVDEEALLRFVGARKAEGGSPNSIRLDLKWLKLAMTTAHQRRKLPWVPKFPRVREEHREQTIRPDELEVIMGHMPYWWRIYFLVAFETGWRAGSELRTRKWTDVDWEQGWLVLPGSDSKTGGRRVFPLTQKLRAILLEAQDWVEQVRRETRRIIPWVFCRPDGSPLGRHKEAWGRAVSKAGFGKLEGRSGPWSSTHTVHDLRRTAIRRFEAAGLPRNVSQGMVGHGSERTFSAYAGRGADPEALRRAAEVLDAQVEDKKVEQIKRG